MKKSDVDKILGVSENIYGNVFRYEARKDLTVQFDSPKSKVVSLTIGAIGAFKISPLFRTTKGAAFYTSDKDFIATHGKPDKVKSNSFHKNLTYGDATFRFSSNGWLYDVFLGDSPSFRL